MAKHNEELQRRWQRFDRDESAVMVILASEMADPAEQHRQQIISSPHPRATGFHCH